LPTKSESLLSRSARDIDYEDSLFKSNKNDGGTLKHLSYSLSADKNGFKVGTSAVERNGFLKVDEGSYDISVLSGSLSGRVDNDDIHAMAKAALAKVEVNLGPLSVNSGVTFDTGVKANQEGLGVYLGGVGMTIGPKTDISTPIGGFSIDFRKIFEWF
jgi:hypothetical protein